MVQRLPSLILAIFFSPILNLRPEEITTYEFGLQGRIMANFHLSATLFRNEMKDLIGRSDSLPRMADNTDEVTTQGLEIEVRYELSSGLRLRANYTYVDLSYDPGYPHPCPHATVVQQFLTTDLIVILTTI